MFPDELIDEARREIGALVAERPPADGHRGPHSYWPRLHDGHPLLGLLPGGPHIDGLTPLGPDGAPQTFTLLAGVLLTDQPADDMGNLWVWPGTHLATASYLRQVGPDALATSAPYPPVELPEPEQVHGRAGDLLLAHYLLAHNVGGNTAAHVREGLYYRLHAEGHRPRWRELVQDALAEFPAVRDVLSGDAA